MAAQHFEHEFDLEAFASSLPDEYLDCREERRHLYAVSYKHKRKQRVYEEYGVCQRCTRWRLRLIGDDNSAAPGHVIEEKTGHYPKGYLAVGSGRITKEDMSVLRLAKMKRHTRETKSIPRPADL